jgi:hypothetical protein
MNECIKKFTARHWRTLVAVWMAAITIRLIGPRLRKTRYVKL